MFRVRDNPRQSRVKERLWRLAARLLPPGEAGRFNQAMMDLGATVCTPRAPRCDACPLEAVCDARRHGDENSLPVRARPRPVPHHDVAVAVIRKRGRILIARRKPEGFLGGLWEFPGGKCPEGEPLEACLLREVREELAIRVRVVRPLATARHAYSHFRVTLHAFECRHLSGTARPLQSAALKWVTLGQIDRYAFPRGTHKIIAALRHDPDAG